jgi:hypothetical protein
MNASNSPLTTPWRIGIFAILAIIMLATRSNLIAADNHFGGLPDASWPVFFVAGFYLRGSARWAFPALMLLAVAVDYFVITAQGLGFWEHYCVSPAYWFLLPSYAALWFGGSWLRRHYHGLDLRALGWAALAAVMAGSVCYALSNGSYYWLSDHWLTAAHAPRSFAGWMENLGDWYPWYLRTMLVYVGIAAVLHVLATQALRWLPARAGREQGR